MPASTSVQSIDRIFEIIETLSCHSNGMYLTDLTVQVDLPKSTVHRLLSVLTAHGYVAQDALTKRYRLTPKLYEISSRVITNMDILSLAKPYLDDLSELTNEVVHLVVREDTMVTYIYKADSSSTMVRMASHVGLHNPMYCTGVGKAIMAFLTGEENEKIWNTTEILSYTEKTIVTFDQLQAALDQVKKCGYAIDDEEHEIGVSCIAAPIFNNADQPIAAMSISTSVTRMDSERIKKLAPKLLEACHNVSALLGQTPAKTI